MDDETRLNLRQMLKKSDVEQTTEKIRELKHSKAIKKDIDKMQAFKRKYTRLAQTNKEQYKSMAENQCSFLYNNYTNIFHRLLKNELDVNILYKFVDILAKIETQEIDQHEGSYEVGCLLKKLYIDSALRQENSGKKSKKKKKKQRVVRNITWAQYKALHLNEEN